MPHRVFQKVIEGGRHPLQFFPSYPEHQLGILDPLFFGTAIACSDLAGLALSQRRIRNGRKYLELARREETLARALDDDNLAAVSSMQGWLAQLQGDLRGR